MTGLVVFALCTGCAGGPGVAGSGGTDSPGGSATGSSDTGSPDTDSPDTGSSGPAAPSDRLAGTEDGPIEIVVYAAASLTDAFGTIADLFEQQHPGATVTLSLGGSSSLAAGIVAGAPADVFASASAETMRTVVDAGLAASGPVVFATNSLEIAVPVGNPGSITGLPDFADEAKTIALCAPEVPCGAASDRLLQAAGVTPKPDTLEQDVRGALTRVELGEVDAALVYRTDVAAAGERVEGIQVPGADDVTTDYLIGAVSDAPQPEGAAAFVDFVQSEAARDVLEEAGFGAP